MLTGRDILCLSTQDWNGLWTRKQRFMQMFARQGNRVLYVETPVHWLGLDVLPHDPTRPFRFLKGPRAIEKNLYVGTLPVLLPFFQMSPAVNSLNHAFIRPILRRWIHALGFNRTVLWVYTPFSASLVDCIENAGCVYECVDEFRAARGFIRSSVIGAMEDELLRKADLTIVTQESLLPPRAAICRSTFCVPNGADIDLFREVVTNNGSPSPKVVDALPRPRLGFVGHIQYWVDLKLIRFVAEKRPDWSFVIIGPAHPMADLAALKGLSNVHLLGRRDQSEIPGLLKAVDVCINPYKADGVAAHASPLKLYEYLAAGKPVVSTDMPEARKFEGDVLIADSYTEFLEQCDRVISRLPEPPSTIQSRLARISVHSWQNRFANINEILERHLPAAV